MLGPPRSGTSFARFGHSSVGSPIIVQFFFLKKLKKIVKNGSRVAKRDNLGNCCGVVYAQKPFIYVTLGLMSVMRSDMPNNNFFLKTLKN